MKKWKLLTHRKLQVCTHAVAALDFCCNRHANKLSVARAMYDFAMSTSYDNFQYNCRIGQSVAWSTIYNLLKQLSVQEANMTKERGRDLTNWGVIVLDNVQNYLLQQDLRIGRVHTMNIGIAATYVEVEGVDPKAHDLDDKLWRIRTSARKDLTTQDLLGFLDQTHLDTVFSLHWLLVLARYIPELAHIKSHVSTSFRTQAAKQRLPSKANKVHPLATSGKNETVTTELRDALEDFMEQVGQTADDYQRKVMPVSGDGMTFEKIHQAKKYLQYHDDDFESHRTTLPSLCLWHTVWTDVSRICETHWGETLSHDPSTLGHSATRIGRSPPPSLKKVDYYPFSELIYLILDVRMLDCWR